MMFPGKKCKSFSLKQGVTRRGFICKFGWFLATILPVFSLPDKWFGNAGNAAFSAGVEGSLLEKAPNAKYFVSVNKGNTSCSLCHADNPFPSGTVPKHEERYVKCLLCARGCMIGEGKRGKCEARINIEGELKSLVYGRPVAIHVDPIEKKPFYHYLPGSFAFSLSTTGCPLTCGFCQNWEISQAKPEDYSPGFVPPEVIVEATRKKEVPVIAFTYNEPTVFFEYLTDIARLAEEKHIRKVLVSCGYMAEAPLREMCDVLDAIKIDLKGYDPDFYRRVCGGELKPVLRSIRQVARSGVHLEIVNLVVPTLNDSKRMLTELAKWIIGETGPDTPVHFTRFHPDYKIRNLPPTPRKTLETAYEIAKKEGLRYPYVGNLPGHPGNHTYCPRCGKPVILRTGFFVTEKHLKNGRCEFCDTPIAGVWT